MAGTFNGIEIPDRDPTATIGRGNVPLGLATASVVEVLQGLLSNKVVTPGTHKAALPHVDVREFFADTRVAGTTDDTAAIQAAEDSISTGGVLVFPQNSIIKLLTGVIKHAATVWIGVGNNSPAGQFQGSTIRYHGEGAAITVNESPFGIRGSITGFRIEYAGALGAATTSIGLSYAGTSGAAIHDTIVDNCYIASFKYGIKGVWAFGLYMNRVYVAGARETGVHLTDCHDGWFVDSEAGGLTGYGVYALRCDSFQVNNSRPQVAALANLYVQDSTYFSYVGGVNDSAGGVGAGTRYGVHLVNVHLGKIIGVTFYGNGPTAEIVIESTTGLFTQAIVINGNTFAAFTGAMGVRVISAGITETIAITSNIVNSASVKLATFDAPTGTLRNIAVNGNIAVGGIVGTAGITGSYRAAGNVGITDA